MRSARKLLILLVASCVLQGANGGGTKNQESTVAHFGYYQLDLNMQMETFLPGRPSYIRSCSSERFFCYKASSKELGIFNLVIPRRCFVPKIGDGWAVAGMKSRVVARDRFLLDNQNVTAYELATKGFEQATFWYAPRKGIIAIDLTLQNGGRRRLLLDRKSGPVLACES